MKLRQPAQARVSRPSSKEDRGINEGHSLDLELAQRIVNDYGRAMQAVSRVHRERVLKHLGKGANNGALLDSLSRIEAKEEMLPYPKPTIRAAIELLLAHDNDPDNRLLLEAGILYLEVFR